MHSLNYLVIAAVVTLLAGLVPLVPMVTPGGALVEGIAIAVAILGFATTVTLYFGQDISGNSVDNDNNCCSQ
jgi:hypothetical protein